MIIVIAILVLFGAIAAAIASILLWCLDEVQRSRCKLCCCFLCTCPTLKKNLKVKTSPDPKRKKKTRFATNEFDSTRDVRRKKKISFAMNDFDSMSDEEIMNIVSLNHRKIKQESF